MIQPYFNALAPLETNSEQFTPLKLAPVSPRPLCRGKVQRMSADRGLFPQPCSLLGPRLPWLISRRKKRISREKREREAQVSPGIGSERTESCEQPCQDPARHRHCVLKRRKGGGGEQDTACRGGMFGEAM